ncbi:hypothetical protein DN069_03305 [Streptacidiphilus pinicola]|uniref:ACT domain-containing protein n=1 Tax=Streptacidiphilus pinicola TaxID=2219663 RepID=A0A2X0IP49_9ACTN|nr:hypothetical protein [Streptacidiphilus pinicola]RAG87002.1 hypothetical protein DN069_03305 [Streptacidiphilus pinicola]
MSTVLETPVPRPARVATGPTLIATAVPGGRLLGRLAAVLSAHPVQTLAVRTDPAGRAIIEITVAEAHRARIRGKLLRMVDVLDVVDATDV